MKMMVSPVLRKETWDVRLGILCMDKCLVVYAAVSQQSLYTTSMHGIEDSILLILGTTTNIFKWLSGILWFQGRAFTSKSSGSPWVSRSITSRRIPIILGSIPNGAGQMVEW